jgi:hypothetical protein
MYSSEDRIGMTEVLQHPWFTVLGEDNADERDVLRGPIHVSVLILHFSHNLVLD